MKLRFELCRVERLNEVTLDEACDSLGIEVAASSLVAAF